ncbi:MAG: pyridoxal phosphate-dependent aminotransferase [Candidatus Nezhaarchaeales archaeon]
MPPLRLSSELACLIPPSETLGVVERIEVLKRRGVDVVRFDVGEPDFKTPEHIQRAALNAISEGFTKYTSSRGILELRQAIALHVKDWIGLDYDPESEIIATPGAKFAIYAAIQAVVNRGDEVIILTPAWPTYKACVLAVFAKPVEVAMLESYKVNEEGVKNAITSRTRMIMVNTPNNPTGGVLSVEDLKLIADLAVDHSLLVLSDEIYKAFVFEGKHVSIASLPGMRERTIIVDGLSKTYSMTGWRLGFALAPREVVDAMVKIQQASTTCPASFVQKAGIAALTGPQDVVKRFLEEYDRRRRRIIRGLNQIEGVKCNNPQGAFYVFPDFSSFNIPSKMLAERLLMEAGVATVAGSPFGPGGEGKLRIAYTTSMDRIEEGLRRIKDFVDKLKGLS